MSKISLVKRKRKDNRTALYLRYYDGHYKEGGKIKRNERFESTDLWIFTVARTKSEKHHNKEQEVFADKILKVRQVGLIQDKFDVKLLDNSKVNFIEYFERVGARHGGNYKTALFHLKKFTGGSVRMDHINDAFAIRFFEYLSSYKKTNGKTLGTNTAIGYYKKLLSVNRKAVKEKLSSTLITVTLKDLGTSLQNNIRSFLTKEEVQRLELIDCSHPLIKDAFLFGCYTGLRYSDIRKLRWDNIDITSSHYRMNYQAQKTKKSKGTRLSDQAIEIIEKRPQEDYLFPNLPVKLDWWIIDQLKRWFIKGKISKAITFHSSRHTFAVNFLLSGGSIFVLRDLLQHSSIKTTEQYLAFVPEMEEDAINKLNKYWS